MHELRGGQWEGSSYKRSPEENRRMKNLNPSPPRLVSRFARVTGYEFTGWVETSEEEE